MTDKDEKLILEFCGFKVRTATETGTIIAVVYPNSELIMYGYMSLDLNFYFKYPVPKLLKRFAKYEVMHFLHDWVEFVIIYDRDPAEAFGQALLKVIKEKNYGNKEAIKGE